MAGSVPPPLPRQSRLAWWSLCLGILANMALPIIASIPCIVCGHLALEAMRRDPALLGRKSALAGLTLGYVSVAAAILLAGLWMILWPMLPDTLELWKRLY